MQHPTDPVDLFLAPHHGGKSANTAALAQWANPRHVFASSARDITTALVKIYERADTIHCTAVHGAIQTRISPDGSIQIDPYRTVHLSSGSDSLFTQRLHDSAHHLPDL